MYPLKFTEEIGVCDVLNYQTVTNQSVNSAYGINMANARRAGFYIQVDSLGAAGTVDARLQASQYSNFASPVNLSGTNLTQIVTTSTPSGNNTLSLIEVRADQLAQAGSTLQWVRLNLTGGGNPVTLSAIGFTKETPQRPASQYNATNLVNQSVACSL